LRETNIFFEKWFAASLGSLRSSVGELKLNSLLAAWTAAFFAPFFDNKSYRAHKSYMPYPNWPMNYAPCRIVEQTW